MTPYQKMRRRVYSNKKHTEELPSAGGSGLPGSHYWTGDRAESARRTAHTHTHMHKHPRDSASCKTIRVRGSGELAGGRGANRERGERNVGYEGQMREEEQREKEREKEREREMESL